MPVEPPTKRAIAFVDGQNLFHAAKEAFGFRHPNRWIKIASAFPLSPASRNRRGIQKTDWVPISRGEHEACLDPRDYRPEKAAA